MEELILYKHFPLIVLLRLYNPILIMQLSQVAYSFLSLALRLYDSFDVRFDTLDPEPEAKTFLETPAKNVHG